MSKENRNPRSDRRHAVADTAIDAMILQMAAAGGLSGSTGPNDVAKALAGDNWQALTARIRRAAVRLAQDGRLVILRKGRPVDPTDFKGVYRLRIATPDGELAQSADAD